MRIGCRIFALKRAAFERRRLCRTSSFKCRKEVSPPPPPPPPPYTLLFTNYNGKLMGGKLGEEVAVGTYCIACALRLRKQNTCRSVKRVGGGLPGSASVGNRPGTVRGQSGGSFCRSPENRSSASPYENCKSLRCWHLIPGAKS